MSAELYGALIGAALGIGVLWLLKRAYRAMLRDYFAATWLSTFRITQGADAPLVSEVASRCYKVADYMLEARK